MAKSAPKIRCPICKTPVSKQAEDFPFCSERCRTIDLGKWASGAYVISSPVRDTDDEFEPESSSHPQDDD